MRVCPACGRVAAEEDSYCARCGARLSAGSGGERRALVSIVFADLAGSTALGERLDPEVLRGVQARYFDACARALQAHGGQVEKFIGDAAMAVFGVPRAREDDALRACRAALDVVAGVEELSDELVHELGFRLRVRVGVHSGEVIAGDPTRGQALVTGDAVNTAARLQQSAPLGEILIGSLTRELAGLAVCTEAVVPVAAKGKARPVPAYRLVRHREAEPAVDAGFVGREQDLGLLRDALARVTEGKRAETVVVLGEAGIGKSRLIAEFLTGLPPDARAASGQCLSYGEGITYWPVTKIVDELTRGREDALAQLLGGAGADEPLLVAIGRRPGRVDPEGTLAAFAALLRAVAAGGPLVVVVEDLHWGEPALLHLFEHAGAALTNVAVLLLGTARSEQTAGLGMATRVRLAPLDADAAAALLAARGTAPERRAALVRAAGGNPMFLEQLEAAGDAPDRLPPTLRALLAARIDRLAPAEREVLDAAAVAGREFWPAGLEPLLDGRVSENLPSCLLALEQAELIAVGHADARPELDLRLSGVFGATGRYAFRHSLIQETAYASLSKALAADLHERFAVVLEQERLDEHLPVVAWHLAQAAALRAQLRPRAAALEAAGRQPLEHGAGRLTSRENTSR